MKNEAEYISRKYLNHDSKSPYLECSLLGLGRRKAKRILSNWHSFESPDIYTKYDKTVYGLEHFKYDARKRNKNGSQQRRDKIKVADVVVAIVDGADVDSGIVWKLGFAHASEYGSTKTIFATKYHQSEYDIANTILEELENI